MKESRLWALHLIAGAVLLALLGMHMVVMHYEALLRLSGVAGGPVLEYASVVSRDRSAMMRVLYVLLLGVALYHGIYGLRGILQEVWSSERAGRVINAVLVLCGLAVFTYGAAVIVWAGRHAAAI